MWDDRLDDLWLYPIPRWFVKLCNRWIGIHVLELIVLAEIAGLFVSLTGFFLGLIWLRVVGYVLIAPAPLLILIMLVDTQLIRFGFPKRGSSKDIIRVEQKPRW